ncbi:DinB family protein [Bacillus sp. Cr_A10]|uniref:DinB family protein n=1 Tax=Bacillus sp. Cr_A10 TaxID=3033993 RepID=UPI0023DAC000|nr:DinB family protein [Bacillus sp. Cr_A10]MDF2066445.1 DinB family protein [Bacillus sp. Cr_A10]
MFLYNWQIRNDWFEWCLDLSFEELTKKRIGGMGSILHNLYHVIDCEQLWINQMSGTPVIESNIDLITNLEEVINFSNETKQNTYNFIQKWISNQDNQVLKITSKKGITYSFSYDKILQHIISHETHHIGQLSIWSREIGIKPVSSDILFREPNY